MTIIIEYSCPKLFTSSLYILASECLLTYVIVTHFTGKDNHSAWSLPFPFGTAELRRIS